MGAYTQPAMLNLAASDSAHGVTVVLPIVISILSLWLTVWPWVVVASTGR